VEIALGRASQAGASESRGDVTRSAFLEVAEAWFGTGEHSWYKVTPPNRCNPLISLSFNRMYQIGGWVRN
jgi:hypothetical protein